MNDIQISSSYEFTTISDDSQPVGWKRTDVLTTNLEINGQIPVSGNTYNKDTTLSVKLFNYISYPKLK